MVNEIIEKYKSGMKMRDIAEEFNLSYNKVRNILKSSGVKIRIKNDYGNPAQEPGFADKMRKSRRSYSGENNPNYGKRCTQKAIEATKKANTGKVSPRRGKPYPQSIGWVCKEPDRIDKLYFIKLHSGNYKVGRSYKGWLYRKKETAELLGEWTGKSIDIWNLEKKVINQFSHFKIQLNEMSNGRGMTEHFMKELPVSDVIDYINKNLKSN